MRINHWPKEDRPREKLLAKGENQLTDAELIAIFLNTGTRGKTALDIAKALLTQFGSLKKLLHAPFRTFPPKMGIGTAKFAALKAALELARRYHRENIVIGEKLDNTKRSQKFIADRLNHHVNEVFACIFLDNHFRLLAFEELFFGTINAANIHPREVVRRGLLHNAAKIILAHNHPSGLAEPSQADKDVTELLKEALELVDIEVVDHIIVGHTHHFSFASAGFI